MSGAINSCLLSKKQLPSDLEICSHMIFSSPQFSIGRSLSNLYVLATVMISRTHCKFQKQVDESWTIEDLSSIGCILNGSKMEKGTIYVLKNEDVIQLDESGDFVYEFSQNCSHIAKSLKRRKPTETEQEANLYEQRLTGVKQSAFTSERSEVITSCLLSEKQLPRSLVNCSHIAFSSPQFSIGRNLSNLCVFATVVISRTHCIFHKQSDESWTFQDLSTFGCILNGSKMEKGKKYVLKDKDVIQLDPSGDLVYEFSQNCSHTDKSLKRRKLTETGVHLDMIEHTKQKFETTQSIEVENMETKLKNAKLLNENSKAEIERLDIVLRKEIHYLNDKYSKEIQNLIGEKEEVERQKANLNEQRITEVKQCEENMKLKIKFLEEKISQQTSNEEKLQLQNNQLAERLKQERDIFETLLAEENISKQEMLNDLEAKLQQLENVRLKQKELLDLEKKQMEILKVANEKELKDLQESMRSIMEAREKEIINLQKEIEQKVSENIEVKVKTEQEYKLKLEEMQSATVILKERIDQMESVKLEIQTLQSEKQKIENRLLQNTATSHATVMQLEAELQRVRIELDNVESRRLVLEENLKVTQNQLAAEDVSGFIERQIVLTEFNQLMETELQCTICADLLIAATTLDCSHTFCRYCIEQWKKKKKECPICRSPIKSQCRSLMFDSFINKMFENLAPDVQEKRKQILKDREEIEQESKKEEKLTECRSRRSSSFEDFDYDRRREYWSDESEYESQQHPHDSLSGFDTESIESHSSSEGESDGSSRDTGDRGGGSARTTDYAGLAAGGQFSRHDSFGATSQSGSDTSASSEGGATTSPRGQNQNATSTSASWLPRATAVVAGRSGSYFGGYGQCFNCGASGHWAPGCPFR